MTVFDREFRRIRKIFQRDVMPELKKRSIFYSICKKWRCGGVGVDLGPAEIAIILLILVMVFGATKIGDLGGALGQGIKEFRTAVKDDEPEAVPANANTKAEADSGAALEFVEAMKCQSCGSLNRHDARFCSACGEAISAQAS